MYDPYLVLEAENEGFEVDVEGPGDVFLTGAGIVTRIHDAVVVESDVRPTECVHGLVYHALTIIFL